MLCSFGGGLTKTKFKITQLPYRVRTSACIYPGAHHDVSMMTPGTCPLPFGKLTVENDHLLELRIKLLYFV